MVVRHASRAPAAPIRGARPTGRQGRARAHETSPRRSRSAKNAAVRDDQARVVRPYMESSFLGSYSVEQIRLLYPSAIHRAQDSIKGLRTPERLMVFR